MRKIIWKYEIGDPDGYGLEMPKGAEILTVQIQNDKPYIWALVDENSPIEERNFIVLGTGHSFMLSKNSVYIGTFQEAGGRLVWHLFEVK
jgi:hypothetical protein